MHDKLKLAAAVRGFGLTGVAPMVKRLLEPFWYRRFEVERSI